ncbi:MAG TPA: efflux RND transporter permease subunit [Candidatus Kapabacteria bacterium]|nr:efflux RND transporter permease subunit [Candidatus Kapabacteria bacterium]
MTLSDLSIKRPVLAIVFSLIIILFGLVGYFSLGVREYPSVDPPIISVRTTYTGANADIIESQITEVIEEAISGVQGIKNISSTSSDGRSSITIEFDLNTDMETAANDTRDKVSQVIRQLPPDCDPPVVTKADADAQTIYVVTLQSNQRDLMELTEIANNVVKERMQTIKGVSQIYIWGEKKYAMRLILDPIKMEAFSLTPMDVSNALQTQNIELPTGLIDNKATELSVRTVGRLSTPEQFDNLIIAERNGALIKLRDIGKAVLGAENERTIMRGNGGLPMVGVALLPQPGANYIEIVNEAKAKLENIKKELPNDIITNVVIDNTKSIRKGISEVIETILISFFLVLLVVFFFLRNWRATIIPIIAVPISLVSSFLFLFIFGYSINILSLLGLVLATGLVVDDAIVMLENIFSKMEDGYNPIQAAFKGSKEVFFAVISTTITLISVFLPIFFLSGFTGKLFREFALVLASSILVSMFISLTLTPMMSSRLLKMGETHHKLFNTIENFINNLTKSYNSLLSKFVDKRWLTIPIVLACIAIIFLIGSHLQTELAPMEDKSQISINSTAPEGTSYQQMDNFEKEIIALVDTLPEKESFTATTSPGFGSITTSNRANISITLVDPEKRDRTQMEIADELTQILKRYNFAQNLVIQQPTIAAGQGSRGSLPVQFVLQAPDMEKMRKYLPIFLAEVQKSPVFDMAVVDLKFNKPEIVINIDRNKALDMGISVNDIAQTIQIYLSEQRIGYFIKNGKQYNVIARADKTQTTTPLDLRMLSVRNANGDMVKLDNLVSLQEMSRPPQLLRYNRYLSATISAAPAKGKTIGDGIAEMNRIAKEKLDPTFSTALKGSSADFSESSSNLISTFLFALILVFLILAAQFESFRDPLIIMFTIPLAITGAILSLWITGSTLNIFSEIGMIVLIGIVTKNGILIIEFANQRREQGLSIHDAVIDAATQRFRPILMTSLATILGAVPIALSIGAASTSRVSLGYVIIGGLFFALILTLFVIPALYTYLTSKKERKYVEEEI